jgi:signal peptidase
MWGWALSTRDGESWAPDGQPAAGREADGGGQGSLWSEGAREAAEGTDGEPSLAGSRASERGVAEPSGVRQGGLRGAWERFRDWVAGLSQRPHSPQESARHALWLAGAVALSYWFTQWPLPRLTSGNPNLNFYLAQPVIWLGITALALYGWRRLAERPPFSRLLVGITFLVGVFHVAVLVIAGVVWSFGDSLTAGKIINYPKNLWYIATLLAGAEAARAYLFHVWRQRSERLAFGATTLLFFVLATPAAQWTSLDSVQRSFEVVGGRWLPTLALSALCTWLVSYGGIGPSFAYRFALVGFEWFSPILPNLEWPVLMAIGLIVPMISSWLVEGLYEDTAEGRQRVPQEVRQARKEARAAAKAKKGWWYWTSWVLTLAVLAAGVLFVTGFMGFQLVTIDGVSMEPAYSRGDVAIVREGVDPASLAVDDVVLYFEGSLPVVHRIIAIEEGDGGRVFTTQGDNVDNPDSPIGEDEVEGKVVFVIPGVGYLNLWLRGR